MSIDDNTARSEAATLKNSAAFGESDNYTNLHNQIISLRDQYKDDPNSFNKIMDEFAKPSENGMNSLPKVELQKEYICFGNVSQVVLNGVGNNQKLEIFESDQHRANEVKDQENSANNLNPFREWGKAKQSDWLGSKADFQLDSSQAWTDGRNQQGYKQQASAPGFTVSDHSNAGNTVGAYNYEGAKRVNSDAELLQMLNNPPKGFR